MSRRQKLIFVAWCLFPFVLALGFRAVDNYQFDLERHHKQKLNPDYFPSFRGMDQLQDKHEVVCSELGLVGTSIIRLKKKSQVPEKRE